MSSVEPFLSYPKQYYSVPSLTQNITVLFSHLDHLQDPIWFGFPTVILTVNGKKEIYGRIL